MLEDLHFADDISLLSSKFNDLHAKTERLTREGASLLSSKFNDLHAKTERLTREGASVGLNLRLLRTFAGVLGQKICMRAILKEKTANYISLESLINVDFGKNINCRFLQFHKRKSQTTTKMTICHSIELIGYQIQADWQNNCTVLITQDQSSKVCQHFSIL